MTRERIDEARAASPIGDGMSPELAGAWIAAWEAQAAQDGLERGAAYWDAGWEWIAAQRKHGVQPYGTAPIARGDGGPLA